MNCKKISISECIEIIGGGTPKTSKKEYWGGEIPWLSVVDFNNDNRYVSKTEKTITQEGLNNCSSRLLGENDIILSARGTVGALAQLSKPMAFNQSCYGIRANELAINDYIYYLLKHSVSILKKNSYGSVFDTITRETFSRIEILLPDLKTQKRISAVLGSLDNKIELNEKINQNLEAQAQAIFKSWFVDFEPFKNGKFVDSELGKIPEGWRVEKLGQILNIRYGKNLPQTKLKVSGYPVYGANGQIGFYSEYMFKSPQVLVSCRGAASGKVNISTKNSFITNNSLILDYTTSKTLSFEYLKYYALRADFSPFVTGSAQPQITIETISSAKILVPNKQIMNKFNLTIFPILNAIFKNNEESCYLSQLRDTLLPKLMSGEIDVSDVAV